MIYVLEPGPMKNSNGKKMEVAEMRILRWMSGLIML